MPIWMPPWHWFVAAKPDVKPPEPDDAPDEGEPDLAVTDRIRTVGAWCGASALRRPVRALIFAVDHGINRLDLIVNDHSGWRDPHNFSIRRLKQIEEFIGKATMRGIDVHLMSWIMPHEQYIAQAAEVLVPLCHRAQVRSLVWDAEEPWTQAKRRPSYRRAAQCVKERFADLPCPMGVTGIGYAPVSKLRPLADVCDYAIPQAYSTKSSGLKPSTAPAKFHRRWTQKFGLPVTVGLAAYRQKGIKGHSPASAILAAADAAAQCSDTIVYWSLASIRRSPEVARAVASLRYRPLALPR